MKDLKCTYDNWLSGDVRLNSSNSSNLIVEESTEVDIEVFTDADQDRIRQTQGEIFENDASAIFLGWKENTNRCIKNSKMPKRYLQGEISQCIGLLENPLPKTQNIVLHIWKMKLDRSFVGEVKNYYSRVILEGQEQDFSYISSPNDPFRFDEQDPYSYSEAIVRYCSWLSSILNDNNIVTIESWHPEVFMNSACYNLFMDFVKSISKPDLKWADLCFIFHEMYAEYYIVEQQTHKSFIKFVNQKFNIDFDQPRIPKRSQKRNLLIYSQLLNKYEL
jgi:hypothetical protein